MAIYNFTFLPCSSRRLNHIRMDTSAKTLSRISIDGFIDPSSPCILPGTVVYTEPGNVYRAYNTPPHSAAGTEPPNLLMQLVAPTINYTRTIGLSTVTITSVTGAGVGGSQHALLSLDNPANSRQFQNSTVFADLPTGRYMLIVKSVLTGTNNKFEIMNVYGPVTGFATVTDTTSEGGTDGAVVVHIEDGSGHYEVTIGASTQPVISEPFEVRFSDLAAGDYLVTIHDVDSGEDYEFTATVHDPGIPVPESDYFFVPPMQSLQFVHEQTPNGDTILQNMDNRLFENRQETTLTWTKEKYFTKLTTKHKFPIQWQSNYTAHEVTIRDYCTDEIKDSLIPAMVVQNIGVAEIIAIKISDNETPGQSRVVFNTLSFPIPVAVGDSFAIMDNTDGLDGSYTILSIGLDTETGQQYFVISLVFPDDVAVSEANGRFFTNLVNFNIFESQVDWSAYEEGKYYVKIRAINGDVEYPYPALSEPIDLAEEHPKCNILKWKNSDNSQDIDYTTGIQHMLLVESNDFKRKPAGIIDTLRNTTGELRKLRALKIRKFLFEVYNLPPWMLEKVSCIFDNDYITLNNVEVASEEELSEPTYLEEYDLAISSITLEQVGWFKTHNSKNLNALFPAYDNNGRIHSDVFSGEFN